MEAKLTRASNEKAELEEKMKGDNDNTLRVNEQLKHKIKALMQQSAAQQQTVDNLVGQLTSKADEYSHSLTDLTNQWEAKLAASDREHQRVTQEHAQQHAILQQLLEDARSNLHKQEQESTAQLQALRGQLTAALANENIAVQLQETESKRQEQAREWASRCEISSEETAAMRNQLEILKAEREEEKRSLESKCTAFQQQVELYVEELAEKGKKFEHELQSRVAELQAQHAQDVEAQLENLHRKHQQFLEEKENAWIKERTDLSMHQMEAEQMNQQLRNEIEELLAQLTLQKTEAGQIKASLDTETTTLEQEKLARADLQRRLEELHTERKQEIEAKSAEVSAEMETLRKQLEDSNEHCQQLVLSVEQAKKEKEEVEARLADRVHQFGIERDAMLEHNATLEKEVGGLRQQLREEQEQHAQFQAAASRDKDSLLRECLDAKQAAELLRGASEGVTKDLSDQLAAASAEILSLTKGRDELCAQMDTLNRQLEAKNKDWIEQEAKLKAQLELYSAEESRLKEEMASKHFLYILPG